MYKLIFIIPAVLLIVLGILMFKFKMVELIAGYDPKKVKDKDGLARWVGTNFILMGLLIVFLVVLGYLFQVINMIVIAVAFVLLIVILCIRTALGCSKYEYPS